MRLLLVRHGDAYAGFHGVIGGARGCRGLTPLGRRQAGALGDYLAGSGRVRADVLLASELPRAIETAEIVAPGLGLRAVRRECDLCEVHTGDADGLSWTEYAARYGRFDMAAEPDRVFAPGGDSWTSFHDRVERMLGRVATELAGQTVVAVCHAGVIMASLRILLGIPQGATGAQLRPTNTGLTEWSHDDESGAWTLVRRSVPTPRESESPAACCLSRGGQLHAALPHHHEDGCHREHNVPSRGRTI